MQSLTANLVGQDTGHTDPVSLSERRHRGKHDPEHIDVLVIEDSQNDFDIISRTLRSLESFKCQIAHATDPENARILASQKRYDVVLVDFWLGVETGIGAIHDLGGRFGSSAVILLTGRLGQDVGQTALAAGAIHCMDKNKLDSTTLETSIRCALYTFALELKLQETIEDLKRVSRAKSDFFARMGHDLKTPLNAILGYSEMISLKVFGQKDVDKYAECADNIQTGGTHLLDVLNNLIHHAASQGSFSSGLPDLEDVNGLIRRAVALVEILAKSRDQIIELELPDKPIPVGCQPSVLTQAFLNILSNSVKYTPVGGKLSISIVSGKNFNEIRFQDNGIGMSEEGIRLAMLPFHRVEQSSDLAQEGTGIGLPIALDIVKEHNGTLEIESEPGKGTIVKVRLPAISIT